MIILGRYPPNLLPPTLDLFVPLLGVNAVPPTPTILPNVVAPSITLIGIAPIVRADFAVAPPFQRPMSPIPPPRSRDMVIRVPSQASAKVTDLGLDQSLLAEQRYHAADLSPDATTDIASRPQDTILLLVSTWMTYFFA